MSSNNSFLKSEFYLKTGTKCSFAFELRDKGTYGFLLPANQIGPVASEMWSAFKILGNNVINEVCKKV